MMSAALGACGSSREQTTAREAVLEPPHVEASGPLTLERGSTTLTGIVNVAALPTCDPPECRLELEYDIALSQLGTAVVARRFSGTTPLESAGEQSFSVEWDGGRDDPPGGAAPDDVYRGDAAVRIVKREAGRSTTVAAESTVGSHPSRFAIVEVARANRCEGCGTGPVTYPRSSELVCPLLEGADLGQPATGDSTGFPGVALMFGDAFGGVVTGALSPSSTSFIPMLSRPSSFVDPFGNAVPGNDDVLGWLAPGAPPEKSSEACSLGLDFQLSGGSLSPITMDGAYGDGTTGGTFLGAIAVPGSPFFVGGRLFTVTSAAEGASPSVLLWWLECAVDSDCPSGDRCLSRPWLGIDGSVAGAFNACIARGDCPDPTNPSSPCFVRPWPRQLGVSTPSSPEAFATPGIDAATNLAAAAELYPKEFALTSAFVDAGPPEAVYVLGRESLDGIPGTWSSAVHLLRHRIDARGRLEPAEIFAGCRTGASTGADATTTTEACSPDAEPVFARGAQPATLYHEEKAIVTNTRSVVSVPELGIYLMLYGGRRPASFLTGPARIAHPLLTADAIGDELSGIYVRVAPRPWGPWSATKTVFSPFSPVNDGYCRSMYYDALGAAANPRFACPAGSETANRALARNPVAPRDSGAEYGAGIIPSLVRVVSTAEGAGVVFDWVLSTWNPYGVVVMRTELAAAETSADVRPSQRTDEAVRATLVHRED